MLRHLSIRDFVIVAALDLEFDSGFTVFSGETGAGKSILIDALALALGERADASVVRTGSGRADISAEFTPHDRVARWLDEHAFDADDTVMLRRVVDANGRSRAFINGTSATLAQLREVGEMLVDIHGQHAHQLLMRADAQRELFDTHAGLAADAAAVARGYRAWRDATHAIDAAQAHERERQLEREKLAWQLAELDKLAPQPGEWDEITAEHKRLTHSANLIDGVQGALGAISESDDAMLTQLGAIVSRLRASPNTTPRSTTRSHRSSRPRSSCRRLRIRCRTTRSGSTSTRTGSRRSRRGSTRCTRPRASSGCRPRRCTTSTRRAALSSPSSTPRPI